MKASAVFLACKLCQTSLVTGQLPIRTCQLPIQKAQLLSSNVDWRSRLGIALRTRRARREVPKSIGVIAGAMSGWVGRRYLARLVQGV
jgi:hypothetical protein